jgi:hypothetical protein
MFRRIMTTTTAKQVRKQSRKAIVTPAMADPQVKPEVATFANQSKLPRLPVPDLDVSMQKFKSTCLPLARTKEEWSAFEDKMTEFAREKGPELQRRLLAYASRQEVRLGHVC